MRSKSPAQYMHELREARLEVELCAECGMEALTSPWQIGERCRTRKSKVQREIWAALKDRVLEGYGRVCVCCGEEEPSFLNLDYIKGQTGEGRVVAYYRAIRENYPPDLQLLCYNCNLSREHQPNRICVHVTNKSP